MDKDNDDDSFIILSASPPPNVVFDFNGLPEAGEPALNASLHELMSKVNQESGIGARIAVIENGPSQSSLMVASTILTDKTPEELETSIGEIIEENVLLKETLKKNNDSLREQFLLIASCQEDMVKTHQLHREKFSETKELVDRLRQENKTLKQEMMKLLDSDQEMPDQSLNNTTDSLTQSVDYLKQSAKLNVKSANNHIKSRDLDGKSRDLDGKSTDLDGKSRDLDGKSRDIAGKSTTLNVRSSVLDGKSTDLDGKSTDLYDKSTDLDGKSTDVDDKSGFKSNASSMIEFVTSPDDDVINKLTAQLELVEKQRRQVIIDNDKLTWQKESLERVVDASTKERDQLKVDVNNLKKNISKMEYEHLAEITRHTTKIQQLENALLDYSKNIPKKESEHLAEITRLTTKIQQLENTVIDCNDKISKDETEYLAEITRLTTKIQELENTVLYYNKEISKKESVHLAEIAKLTKENQELENILKERENMVPLTELRTKDVVIQQYEVKVATLQNELKKAQLKVVEYENNKPQSAQTHVEPLTSALLARAEELKAAQSEVADLRRLLGALRGEQDERDLLRAQLDVYKSDFLCEREAREKLACEKETVAAELRGALKKKQELTEQLEEVRKLNPNIHKAATTKRCKPQTLTSARLTPPEGAARTASAPTTTNTTTTGNMVYTCPKCTRFSSDQYRAMEDHFDFCLDDF